MIVLGLTLFTSLMADFVPEASAIVCPPPSGYKSIGGTCYKVKGVQIDAEVKFTGQLQRNPKSFHGDIAPQGVGILYCGNQGGNQPPGQRLVVTSAHLTCSQEIFQQNVVSSQNGGTAKVTCTAQLDPFVLQQLGDENCAPGHEAFDYVPCEFLSDVTYTSDSDASIIETARHHCWLPSCETLGWNNKTGLPEPRDYECDPDPIEIVP